MGGPGSGRHSAGGGYDQKGVQEEKARAAKGKHAKEFAKQVAKAKVLTKQYNPSGSLLGKLRK